jgi:protein involved in polysaccharide export with SLBB domain
LSFAIRPRLVQSAGYFRSVALIFSLSLKRSLLEPALRAIIWLVLGTSVVFAQGIQLSAEQQQMLNQLPPAQRQQAMDAIRQLQSQQSAQSTTPIREEPSTAQDSELLSAVIAASAEQIPTAKARSRIIIDFVPRSSLTPAEVASLNKDPVLKGLQGSQLYILDDAGVLSLQGLDAIPLLGLVEEDIERRLGAEPYLNRFDIDVRILGQESIGIEALEPFGYDVFEAKDATFDAPSSGPVPPDYVLGPGDSVRVQLFGNVNGIYEYEVSRDGILNLPEIGPVTVAGLPFSEFRADLNKRVKEMLIGTQVSVTMGQLRTIRVFVLGDVNQPGSYVVSALVAVGGALYQSGGISKVGSLRNIQLKRNGRLVATLDLYDALLKGDTSSFQRLQPGDVIFVPPIGTTIGVGGAVKRPAIYETKGKATIADAVKLAGGLAPDAFAKGARIERIDGERTTIAVDLTSAESSRQRVRSGDTLVVPDVLPSLEDTVVLAGHVFRPGNYQWRPGMRLTDLIGSADELKPGVDTDYVLIRRETKRGQPIQVLSANLSEALKTPAGTDNVRLEASDTVHVFSLALGRQRVVEPLLQELRLQSTFDAPVGEVQISGNVRAPGVYPLESKMRVSDLIRAGGNLSENAYSLEAELTRYSSTGTSSREIEVVQVDLDAIRGGVDSANLVLREHDYLIIKRIPDWDTKWTVALDGEVRFPGEYRVRRGETLGEVLQRAGGLTDNAFPEGAVFLRETLKEQEQEQIETLARRLEADVATLSLQAANEGSSETLTTGRVLLDQLRNTEAVGRLVLDMTQDGSGRYSEAAAVELRDGDQLLVPSRPQVVTVLGEIQQNTSHLYRDNLSRNEYIDLSGGLTRRADKKLIYVVRANGAVVAGNRSRWLGRGGRVDIRPGDTIVVPLDTDRMRPLTFWTNVTQILYQAAIAVAAVQTFDN